MTRHTVPKDPIGAALYRLAEDEGFTAEKLRKADVLLALLPENWTPDAKEHVMKALIFRLFTSIRNANHRAMAQAALNVEGDYTESTLKARVVKARRDYAGKDSVLAKRLNLPNSRSVYDAARNWWLGGLKELADLLPAEIDRRNEDPEGWADMLKEYKPSTQHYRPGDRVEFETENLVEREPEDRATTTITTVVRPVLKLNDPLPTDYQKALAVSTPVELSTELELFFEPHANSQTNQRGYRLIVTRVTHHVHDITIDDPNYDRRELPYPIRFVWLVGHGQDALYQPVGFDYDWNAGDMLVDPSKNESLAQKALPALLGKLNISCPSSKEIADTTSVDSRVQYLGQDWTAHEVGILLREEILPSGMKITYLVAGGGYWYEDAPFFVVHTPHQVVTVRSLSIKAQYVRAHEPPHLFSVECGVSGPPRREYSPSFQYQAPVPNSLYGFAWSPYS